MSEPARAEMIVYMTEWAAKYGATLQISGQCGFGRECTGIEIGSHYIDTAEAKQGYYDGTDEWWQPEDAYHKHDCMAVLGHGDGPLRQLYDWVKWLDEHGWGIEEVYRRPSSDIDLLFHGASLPKLVKISDRENADV